MKLLGVSLTLIGSGLSGLAAAALVGLLLHSAPLPLPVVDRFAEAWDSDAAAIDAKSNRLPLKFIERAPWPAPQGSAEPTPAPDPPPRELTQVAPEIVARRPVESNLCTRHGLRKVWVNSQRWRCR